MTDVLTARALTAGPAWMLIVEGDCDQIVGSAKEAKREAADLRRMDVGKVTVRQFATWQEAEAFEDKLRGY